VSVIIRKNQIYKPPLPKGRGTAPAVEGYNFEFRISNFEFSKPLAVEGYLKCRIIVKKCKAFFFHNFKLPAYSLFFASY